MITRILTFLCLWLIWCSLAHAKMQRCDATKGVQLTGVITMKLDADWLTTRTSNFTTLRQTNVQIALHFMDAMVRDRQVLEWLVFVTGECAELRKHHFSPALRCFEIQPRWESFSYKMPYANALLKRARAFARGSHLMYMNTDVVLLGDLASTVQCVHNRVQEPHVFLTSYTWAVAAPRFLDWHEPADRVALTDAINSPAGRRYEEPGWAWEYFIGLYFHSIFWVNNINLTYAIG